MILLHDEQRKKQDPLDQVSITAAAFQRDSRTCNAESALCGTFLIICPGKRDDRELARLNDGRLTILRHEYASLELEGIAGGGAVAAPLRDPLEEVDVILAALEGQPLSGVISTDDYPGSVLACIVAERLGLPAPSPAANLLCQHKYYARVAQDALVPEAVPRFALIDVGTPADLPADMPLPVFVKPVKSFFSIGAGRLDSLDELRRAQSRWAGMSAFFEPFGQLLEQYTPCSLGTGLLVAEHLLSGLQVTLEGYAFGTEIHVLGIVDSIMYPGTIAFERFEYPSSLPLPTQERMTCIARRLMQGIGYRNGMFNIEFMYDSRSDTIGIIEINPRMASQFADLYEKVDGFNSYEILLDLAAGKEPQRAWRAGLDAFAASCVLRTFEDMRVTALPSCDAVRTVEARRPGSRIEVFGREGHLLSEDMQDGHSYRYAVMNLGGSDRGDVLALLAELKRELGIGLEPANATRE